MNGLFIVLFWLSLFFNLVKTSKSGNPSDSVNLAQQVLVPGEPWVCSHSTNGSSDSTPKMPRKRSRRPENWKRNVAKYKRARGEQYVSPSTGKTVPAKTTGNPCSYKNHCFDLFTEEERETTLESFYAICMGLLHLRRSKGDQGKL